MKGRVFGTCGHEVKELGDLITVVMHDYDVGENAVGESSGQYCAACASKMVKRPDFIRAERTFYDA